MSNNVVINPVGYHRVIDGMITMITLDVLDLIWPKIVPLLEKSRRWWEDYYTMDDILFQVRNGDMQLWVAVEKSEIFAMGLTSMVDYPRCRLLQCIFLSGRGAKKILPCVREIEQWAAMLGATKSEIIGRPAWERLGPQYGYVKRSVVMVKQIAATNLSGLERKH